jgi:hypothetical protein
MAIRPGDILSESCLDPAIICRPLACHDSERRRRMALCEHRLMQCGAALEQPPVRWQASWIPSLRYVWLGGTAKSAGMTARR